MPLAELFTIDLAYAAAIALTAGVIKGFAGFGGGMFMVPLLSVLYGPVEAVIMILLLEAPANVALLPRALRDTDWPLAAPLAVATLVSIPIGTYVLVSSDADLLRRVDRRAGALFRRRHVQRLALSRRPADGYFARRRCRRRIAGRRRGDGRAGPGHVSDGRSRHRRRPCARQHADDRHVPDRRTCSSTWCCSTRSAAPRCGRAIVLVPASLVGAWAGTRLFLVAGERAFRHFALAMIAAAGLFAVLR